MNYCPTCGRTLFSGQNFCSNCGTDLRPHLEAEQGLEVQVTSRLRGLGRNAVVDLTREGMLGAEIHSNALLLLSLALPFFLAAAIFVLVQIGSLAVYIALWIMFSGLLYDELKGRRLKSLDTQTRSWLVPWRHIRMADWNGRTLWFSSVDPVHKSSITFDKEDAPEVERTLSSSGANYSKKSRRPRPPQKLTQFWTLTIILFVTSQAILILAATLPFFPGEQQVYTTVLNNTRSQVTGTTFIGEFRAIFLNNVQVAWGGSIPFFGALGFGLASYNTGRVIQVIASGANVPSVAVLISLYILPHTWVEEFSYPMATVAGLLAVTKWRSIGPEEFKGRLNRGSTKLALVLVGVALTLAIAGLIETLTTYLGYFGVVLWIPLGVGYYLLAMNYRRRRQNETAIGSP